MIAEFSPREPHVRRYVDDDDRTVVMLPVDDMGVVQVSEEAMHALLIRAGFAEKEIPNA